MASAAVAVSRRLGHRRRSLRWPGRTYSGSIHSARSFRRQRSKIIPARCRTANLAGDANCELLLFGRPDRTITACATDGTTLWNYAEDAAIDDVWPADLTGDGLDEVIVGYNGRGGLHVLDPAGKLLWKSLTVGNVGSVSAGDLDGDGRAEVLCASHGSVHVYSATGEALRAIRPSFYASLVLPWQPDGEDDKHCRLIVAGRRRPDHVVAMLSAQGREQWVLKLPAGVRDAAFAPQRGWLALALRDGSVRIVDLTAGQEIAHVGGQGGIADVAWMDSPEGDPLLVIANSKQLEAYRVTAESR